MEHGGGTQQGAAAPVGKEQQNEPDSLQGSQYFPEGLPRDLFDEIVPMDIFTAAAIGHFERLRELLYLPETDCDACNVGGWTPLMYAAYVGHDNAINLLLDDGRLNVDVCTPTGCTALILAASCGNESVSYFLLQVSISTSTHAFACTNHCLYIDNLHDVRFCYLTIFQKF